MVKNTKTKKIIRKNNLADNILIIDGLPGCGKTMFSNIFASYNRVELLSYVFEVEFICRLNFFKKISDDAASAMINYFIDTKLYNTMMGRDTNFRYRDLSSVFNYPEPLKYFKRIFQDGDLVVPKRIISENPILNLTTHDLLSMSLPLQKTLKNRLTFLEIVRHPLFMLVQQYLNLERLLNNPRDIQIYFEYKNEQLPYFAWGWEDLFLKSNNIDRTIYSMENQIFLANDFKKKYNFNIITIPFEKFVKKPSEYLNLVSKSLKTEQTKKTKKVLKIQKVPRKNIVDGLALQIYKRCGWEPPKSGISEQEEFIIRRKFAIDQGASKKAIEKLDNLSEIYNKTFLSKEI